MCSRFLLRLKGDISYSFPGRFLLLGTRLRLGYSPGRKTRHAPRPIPCRDFGSLLRNRSSTAGKILPAARRSQETSSRLDRGQHSISAGFPSYKSLIFRPTILLLSLSLSTRQGSGDAGRTTASLPASEATLGPGSVVSRALLFLLASSYYYTP